MICRLLEITFGLGYSSGSLDGLCEPSFSCPRRRSTGGGCRVVFYSDDFVVFYLDGTVPVCMQPAAGSPGVHVHCVDREEAAMLMESVLFWLAATW